MGVAESVYCRAAELRAYHGLKTPDALHLATAERHGCREFWTNDERLHKVGERLVVNILATKS